MSDAESADATDESSQDGGQDSGFTPPATQDDLNRIIDARLKREREKYADYSELQEKAARLAEIEEASKTEAERQAERLAQLEQEAAQARAEALRFKIASKFGVTDDDAELFLTGTDEETLTKQAERLAARNEEAGKPRAPKPDPNQGRQSGGAPSTADQFAATVGGLL